MKRLAVVFTIVALGCGSKREVTGTLVAPHPADTLVLATGSYGTSSATLSSDGKFALAFPPQGTFRVRFVALQSGHRSILGTVVGKSGRPVSFPSNGGAIALGAVGLRGSAPASSASGDPCTGNGAPLVAQAEVDDMSDAGEADAGDEGEHDDVCGDGEHDGGEHDGGELDDGDKDGGEHHDGGEHDDDDHDGGGRHDGGHHDGGRDGGDGD